MLTTIILLILRRYKKNHPERFDTVKTTALRIARVVFLLAIASSILLSANAQVKLLQYIVERNGKNIGYMNIKEVQNGATVKLLLRSDIKMKLFFTFSARGREEAVYDSGLLVYSKVFQQLNGTEKVNQEIRYVNDAYFTKISNEETKVTDTRIYYNLVCIYTKEPLTNTVVWSDKYQDFLPVYRIAAHKYRIKFPDGSHNDYSFHNGICNRVDVHHSFYKATMILQ